MGLSGESRMHTLAHTQLQAPHCPITPSVSFPLLRDAQQACVDEKARAQQLSSPINPIFLLTTCASGVGSTCGTWLQLLLYLTRCFSVPRGSSRLSRHRLECKSNHFPETGLKLPPSQLPERLERVMAMWWVSPTCCASYDAFFRSAAEDCD